MERKLQPVLFARVRDQDLNLVNLEPQFVRVRENNTSFISLDTGTDVPFQAARGVNLVNHTFVTGIRKTGISKIAASSFDMEYITPNVNLRNNNIQFLSSNTGATVHSVIVPEGFYLDTATIGTAISTALNTASGASGLFFTAAVVVTNDRIVTLSCTGGTYHFVLTCSGITHGAPLWNLPTQQTFSSSKTVGYIGFQYSRYLDVESRVLTQYSKNSNSNNNPSTGGNLLLRIFLNKGGSGPLKLQFFSFSELSWMTWNPSETISNVDIRILDQFGEFLYIPTYAEGTNAGFQFRIDISTST